MAKRHRLPLFIFLFLAIVLVVVGIQWTASDDQPIAPDPAKSKTASSKSVLVNEQPWRSARRLAKRATSKEEAEFAQEAMRLSDQELDLAFNTALRQARSKITAASPETLEMRKRVRDLEAQVKSDQADIKRLTSTPENNSKSAAAAPPHDLELTRAELALHQEELEDAKQDLERTGDDAEAKIQRMLSDHQAAEHSEATTPAADAQKVVPFRVPNTLVAQIALWQQSGKRLFYLNRARQFALDYAQRIRSEHDALEQRLKQSATQQAQAPTEAKKQGTEAITALNNQAADRQSLAEYDKRDTTQQRLAQVYADWAALVTTQRQATLHEGLLSMLWILLIVVALVGLGALIDHFLLRIAPDRRRQGAMRLVVRFALQTVGIIAALFILLGRPDQLTTVLGLAGAGLTVALKDFIVGFFGWFVLMGKNGVRVGDWVEINGVGGEVVEIGLLRTVLLETGNWTDSGHPTGRKVTFVNSYAIEGHYFNFTTAGQWLWDTLELAIPAGRTPYPITEAILKFVLKETAADVQLAEEEWQRASHQYGVQPLSAAPSVSVRPSLQGINIIVRYITRANQRYEVRTRLYEGVITLLHQVEPKTLSVGGEGK
jgi:small-conductance mechanosensitive channel